MAVQFDITGDNTGFLKALDQSVSAAKSAGDGVAQAFGKVSELFEGITKAVGIFAAAIAGGETFERAIEATKELDESAINLGKSLGISASTASEYAVAIEEVGGNTQDFAGATQGLTRQLKTHEGALNDMGIATRDISGNLRDMNDIMFAAIATVNSYAEGTDRNLAAQTAFGKGFSATSPILRLTKEDMEEAKKSAEELGLVVGKQNVEAFEENRKATAGAGDVLKGLEKAVGDALLPVLTQLAEWFREIGPSAIQVLRTAMADVVTVFWLLYATINAVWEIMKGVFSSGAIIVSAFAQAFHDAVTGNFTKAKEDLAGIGEQIKKTWSNAFDDIVQTAIKARTKISQAFADPVGDAPAQGGGKSFNLAQKSDTSEEDAYSKIAGGMAKALEEGQRKVVEIAAEELETERALAVGVIATKEEALKQQLKDGELSASQFLKQENQLIDERLAADMRYFTMKQALEANDVVASAKIQTEITKAEQTAQKQRQTALNAASTAQLAVWKRLGTQMEGAFTNSIKGMLEGTETFKQAMRNIFSSLIDGIIGIFVQMGIKWAETMIMQKVMGASTANANIEASAGQAGAAGVASWAAAPWPVDMGAPGFGAAMYGAASAFSIASAAGGWDIPAGMNPVTQLHQNEMVLPAEHADTIRGMKGGGGGDTHHHWSAMDGASVKGFLSKKGNRDQFAKAMRTSYSRGSPHLRR